MCIVPSFFFFFFNDTATTEIYTLSLHDALPISLRKQVRLTARDQPSRVANDRCHIADVGRDTGSAARHRLGQQDRKSTRLNSSHSQISYAVFCLKKKKQTIHTNTS